jgi:Bacterial sugar transferase
LAFCRTYVSPRRKRLFATSGLAAATACAFLLAMSGDARTGFSVVQALFTAKLLVAWLTAMTLIRLIYGLTGLRAPPARRILLVGNALQTKAFSIRLRSRRDLAFDPVVFAAPEISWLLLRQHRIWGVIITSEPDSSAVQTLLDCKLRGTKICSAAAFYENHLGRIDLDMFSASEWLMTPGFPAGGHNAALKRLSDIIVGVALLWLTLPVMALTMLAIKIDSSGPVFYRQQRVGQFGKPFTLLKFRSMTVDAEAGGNPVWAQRNDPRVTRVGRFIRATRIATCQRARRRNEFSGTAAGAPALRRATKPCDPVLSSTLVCQAGRHRVGTNQLPPTAPRSRTPVKSSPMTFIT